MRLDELFSNTDSVDTTNHSRKDHIKDYRFSVDGQDYSISFHNEGDGIWNVGYGYAEQYIDPWVPKSRPFLSDEPVNNKTPFKVLSIVVNHVTNMIDAYKPEMLYFSGDKDIGLDKLYDNMLRLMKSKLTDKGYTVNQVDRGHSIRFEIIKKEQENINEALRPSEYRPLVKGWDKERYANIFKSDKFKHDKNGYRVFLSLEEVVNPVESPVEQGLKETLSDYGYRIVDYKKGIAQNIETKREIKIGKLLTKLGLDWLIKKYTSDPAREGVKDNYIVVISRHPYDIAGMSTGRGWSSCMNLIDGSNAEYVPIEIKVGSVVAYITPKSDPDLKNPTGRIMIKPFVNLKDENDIYFGIEDKVYGTNVSGFRETVSKWVDWVNKTDQLDDVIFLKLKDGSYQDSDDDIRMIGNPKDDEKNLLKTLYHFPSRIENIVNPTEKQQLAAIRGDYEAIRYIENPTETVALAAVGISGFMLKHIKNPSEKVILAAIKSTPQAIQYVKNPSPEMQLTAVKENPITILGLRNPTDDAIVAAIAGNKKYASNFADADEALQKRIMEIDPHLGVEFIDPSDDTIRQLVNAGIDVPPVLKRRAFKNKSG